MNYATEGAGAGLDEAPDIQTAITFLQTLFTEQDLVLFRPIETWTDGDTKRSDVDFQGVQYGLVALPALECLLARQWERSADERTNLFYSVCPRLGAGGRFDLAWQVRTVRALWTDIDHVTVEQVRERIQESGLPAPSIIVNSGNGVHLYWLLSEPYQITDAGVPPAVETEWTTTLDGRRKPRKYVNENGEKVYLDQRRHASRLSPQAEHIQDVLAGIAEALGGDHTTDLSRLLRLPGSLNRKNERNGKAPLPTALIECETSRRYSLALFEPRKVPSPQTKQSRQIAAMPLPQHRKLSPANADKLWDLVAACGIAPAGSRSEADFALCCYAIRKGVSKEEVWSRVQEVGKFAEQGPRYFDVTWENAAFEIQFQKYDELRAVTARQAPPDASDDAEWTFARPPESEDGSCSASLHSADEQVHAPRTIRVHPQTTPVGQTLRQVTSHLSNSGQCYLRADQVVHITDAAIATILSPVELAGLLNRYAEFYFVDDQGGAYKPLPVNYGNTWLHHPVERTRLPKITLFSRNPLYADDWRLVAPGFDGPSGIYYAGEAVAPRSGTACLDQLLGEFCFKSVADRTNYLGVLLTILLMPRFLGSKPGVLFNGNQPGLGKSILAQIISILRDGVSTETASYNPNDEEFEKRLGAIVRAGATTIIIDNAKTQQIRAPRIDSAVLERSITDPILSFRLLGQSASIRVENSHIFAITANSPNVSPDLVSRCVVVNLYFEGNPEQRRFKMDDPEAYARAHRLELLAELTGMVEFWKGAGRPEADCGIRFNKKGWGRVVGGILSANGQPDFLENMHQATTDLDETRREFGELVAVLAEHPQGTWTAADLVEQCLRHKLLERDLGDGSVRSRAIRMGLIAGKYVAECFELPDQHSARFHRSEDRKGMIYRVAILQSAEC